MKDAVEAREINLVEQDGLPRWAPSWLPGTKPFTVPDRTRNELLRIARCPMAVESEFIAGIQRAAGSYLAQKEAIKKEKPAVVLQSLRKLERRVLRSLEAAKSLSDTAEVLFANYQRYPRTTLLNVLREVRHARAAAERWPKARPIDFPKRTLLILLAHTLRDTVGVKLTASRHGAFHHCAQVLLQAIDKRQKQSDDLTRTLAVVLRLLT